MYIFYPTSILILGPKKMITNTYQNLPHLIFDVNYEEKKILYMCIKHTEASQFHIINYHIHDPSHECVHAGTQRPHLRDQIINRVITQMTFHLKTLDAYVLSYINIKNYRHCDDTNKFVTSNCFCVTATQIRSKAEL